MIGKYAVITGASRGLGQHLAYRFWDAGYSLGLMPRNIQSMDETTPRLVTSKGGNRDLFACDLSNSVLVRVGVAEISAKAPQINVIVNNAAIQGAIGPLKMLKTGSERSGVNLLSPVAICRGCFPRSRTLQTLPSSIFREAVPPARAPTLRPVPARRLRSFGSVRRRGSEGRVRDSQQHRARGDENDHARRGSQRGLRVPANENSPSRQRFSTKAEPRWTGLRT
jgi:NAD(P)-dependent dehydrogenase (short-subunit alcohol dehydrogenase family)